MRAMKQKLLLFICSVGLLSFLLGLLLALFGWVLASPRLEFDLGRIESIAIAAAVLIIGLLMALLIIIVTRFGMMNQRLSREIIRREEAEQGHLKLERALQQGQTMQAIGTLAGGIAHDFNNILFSIMGFTAMVQDDLEKNSIAYKNLGSVLEASKRGKELVSRILTFSGQRSHHFSSIQLSDVLNDALAFMAPMIPPTVIVKKIMAVNSTPIIGDATQLQQVIVNIMNNAIHAMKGRGTIQITVDSIDIDDDFFDEHPALKQDRYVALFIQDDGGGMDAETQARIFEPFYTTKNVNEGTGLGLSTAHGIVKEHQGDILVESVLGHGTTFTLLFPEFQRL